MNTFCKYSSVYTKEQEQLIAKDFSRLDSQCYLDHAAATLYSESQMANIFKEYSENLYSNPHTRNVSSQQTTDAIDIVRYKILKHFRTTSEEYSIIFTSGATGAIKLVGECFFNEKIDSTVVYLEDNHTSVLGLRTFTQNLKPLQVEEAFNIFSKKFHDETKTQNPNVFSLFAYPAQSNFSGTKYPLTWIEKTHRGYLNLLHRKNLQKWFVLLDAAAYVSTSSLDLSKVKPDFVPISFYKIFGFPTGLGCLLVKNSSATALKKKYFGGGSVLMAMVLKNEVVFRDVIHERFEDGTIPYLSIVALKHCFDHLEKIGLSMELVSKHTFNLASYVYRCLQCYHHSNGQSAVELYHDTNFEKQSDQGAIINFNLLRPNGQYVGFSEVMHIANLFKIHLRTGCCCNPGACQRHLKLSEFDIRKHFEAGHVCGDQNDLVEGYPTGSVRVSFGYMSTKKDADTFLEMIRDNFISHPVMKNIPKHWNKVALNYQGLFRHGLKDLNLDENKIENNHCMDNCNNNNILKNDSNKLKIQFPKFNNKGWLQYIFLYPIKSCGAYVVDSSWKLSETGLKYDRKWMIINSSGTCFSQKHDTNLCLITPNIDLKSGTMTLSFPGNDNISIPLHLANGKVVRSCESKVCEDKILGIDCGDLVANWLGKCLNCSGLRLIRQIDTDEINQESNNRTTNKGNVKKLSLANKAQYLLINTSSILWLRNNVQDEQYRESIKSIILRFRPNFVVNFNKSFIENDMKTIDISNTQFKVTGKCGRCQMICINQTSGEKTKEPLVTLAKEFKGKIQFGIYLEALCNLESNVSLNDLVLGDNF